MTKKLVTIDEVKQKESSFIRSAYTEIQTLSEEDRTIELSFSSELTDVPRWFGLERLDHSQGSVRLDRLSKGGAVLVNHNSDDLVGVVEKVSIGADRKGRAVVRFGNSARAQEIFQDVRDGIRPNVSVSYAIHDMKQIETRGNDDDVYLITDWEPTEISIVSVPADINVGVGRNLKDPVSTSSEAGEIAQVSKGEQSESHSEVKECEAKMPQDIKKENRSEEPSAPTIVDKSTGVNEERERSKAILEMGRQYKAAELASQFVTEGRSVSEFQTELLSKINERGSKPLNDMDSPEIGLSERETREFSFVKAARSLANPGDVKLREEAAFEYECSGAACKN